MRFYIRDATPEDKEQIAQVIVPIQQDEFGVSVTYDEQPDLKDIAGYYQTGTGGSWVAEADGKIVGTIALKDIGNREGALRKMFLMAAYRGKPHFIAGKLLAHLLDHARFEDIKTVYLGTTDRFVAAHKFYEKTGFELIEPVALPHSFPRMAVDTKFYKMEL